MQKYNKMIRIPPLKAKLFKKKKKSYILLFILTEGLPLLNANEIIVKVTEIMELCNYGINLLLRYQRKGHFRLDLVNGHIKTYKLDVFDIEFVSSTS